MTYCTGCGLEVEKIKNPCLEGCSIALNFCEGCGNKLEDSNIHTTDQTHEPGMTETIVVGYTCPHCNIEEKF